MFAVWTTARQQTSSLLVIQRRFLAAFKVRSFSIERHHVQLSTQRCSMGPNSKVIHTHIPQVKSIDLSDPQAYLTPWPNRRQLENPMTVSHAIRGGIPGTLQILMVRKLLCLLLELSYSIWVNRSGDTFTILQSHRRPKFMCTQTTAGDQVTRVFQED